MDLPVTEGTVKILKRHLAAVRKDLRGLAGQPSATTARTRLRADELKLQIQIEHVQAELAGVSAEEVDEEQERERIYQAILKVIPDMPRRHVEGLWFRCAAVLGIDLAPALEHHHEHELPR